MDIPNEVEEALKKVEQFKATATPDENQELERARATISSNVQQEVQERQRAELANKIAKNYPALAKALKEQRNLGGHFPAVNDAMQNMSELDNLYAQREQLDERIALLEAQAQASFAGANAVLEVRAKQEKKEQ